MVTYTDVIEAAIDKEADVLGKDAALRVAGRVSGLTVGDDGTVEGMDRDEKEILKDLVEEYQDVAGSVAATLIARRISDIGGEELDLPQIILERM